jgi:hypothetical protein
MLYYYKIDHKAKYLNLGIGYSYSRDEPLSVFWKCIPFLINFINTFTTKKAKKKKKNQGIYAMLRSFLGSFLGNDLHKQEQVQVNLSWVSQNSLWLPHVSWRISGF